MSTRDRVISVIDTMTGAQLKALLTLLDVQDTTSGKTVRKEAVIDDVFGALHKYADTSKAHLEEGAWEKAAVEKYKESFMK